MHAATRLRARYTGMRPRFDACVGGGGDWAADGLDDDEYLDAPGAWHDGEALGDFMGA